MNAIATVERELRTRYAISYTYETDAWYRRERRGKGFVYFQRKKEVKDPKKLQWIESLAIPPAWEQVRISPRKNAHLLATGIDALGRKQYIYHPKWHEYSALKKFHRLKEFIEVLPRIRRTVEKELRRKELNERKIIATILRILDLTGMRIGNKAYAREHEAYGITTLRRKHVSFRSSNAKLDFVGKSGQEQHICIDDPKVVRVMRACEEIPGYEIFTYYTDEGKVKKIHSEDINAFLYTITGKNITAKDFRTLNGTVEAIRHCLETPVPEAQKDLKQAETAIVKKVAEHLGNTPSVCRKYYILPKVLELWREEKLDFYTEGKIPKKLIALQPSEKTAYRILCHFSI